MENKSNIDQALEKTDEAKRATLRKLVVGAAYAFPLVTSFSLGDLAHAQQVINSTIS